MAMAWVYVVLCLIVIFYVFLSFQVGRMRVKHGVVAPSCTGHPEFERAFRVQMNTLEQLVPFLPMLYLFGLLISPIGAAMLGLVWLVGRILYRSGYMRAAEKRGPGMMLTLLALAAATLGVLGQSVATLLAG
jgi:glutathione S-transferase